MSAIAVDTPFGRRRYAIHNLRDVKRALSLLQAASEQDVRSGAVPRLYSSGVIYKREGSVSGNRRIPPMREDWKRAARVAVEGQGDCEDLATYRVAELRVTGEDPDARIAVYSPRPGLIHVVVMRGDGTVEDPSRLLGMGAKKMESDRIQWKARRTARGAEAALKIPFVDDGTGEVGAVVSRAKARTLRGAIRRATNQGIGALREIGALPPFDEENEVGALFIPGTVEGMEIGASAADTALDATTTALASAGPYGAIAATVLSVLRKAWSWLQAGSHDPFAYLMRWWSENKDPKVTLPKPGGTSIEDKQANLAVMIANGWVLIYCSDSYGTTQNILREFDKRGWKGEGKSTDYWKDKLHLQGKLTHYIIGLRSADAPQAVKDAALEQARKLGPEESMKRTLKFLTGAKGFMKTYGGTEDYDKMIVDALPVVEAPGSRAATPTPPTPPVSATYQPPTGEGAAKGAIPDRSVPERQAARVAASRTPTSAAPTTRMPDRVSAQFTNLRSAVALAQDNDWRALQQFAQVIQRNDPRSPVGRLARMLVKR